MPIDGCGVEGRRCCKHSGGLQFSGFRPFTFCELHILRLPGGSTRDGLFSNGIHICKRLSDRPRLPSRMVCYSLP